MLHIQNCYNIVNQLYLKEKKGAINICIFFKKEKSFRTYMCLRDYGQGLEFYDFYSKSSWMIN